MYQVQKQFFNWGKGLKPLLSGLKPYITDDDIMEFDEDYKNEVMFLRRILSNKSLSLKNLKFHGVR